MNDKHGKTSNDSYDERKSNSSDECDIDKFPLDLIGDNDPNKIGTTGTNHELQDHPGTDNENLRERKGKQSLNDTKTSSDPVETVYVSDRQDGNSEKMRRSHDPSKESLHVAQTPDQEFQEEVHKPLRCQGLLRCCHSCCKPCMTEFNPIPPNPTRCDLFKYSLLCPVHGKLAKILTISAAFIFFWAVLWSLTGDHALPGGNFFALIVLIVCCMAGGALVAKINLPPLLGE